MRYSYKGIYLNNIFHIYKLQEKIHINFALGESKTVYILPQFVFVGETQGTDVLYILLKSNNTT